MTRRRAAARRIAVVGFGVLAASLIAACGGGGDDADGKLTVYSGRDAEYVAPLIERFESETGIDVEVRYGDTAELAATLIEEGENTPAQVFWAQDAGALGAVNLEGLFEELPSDVLDRVPAQFRAKDGRWVGISGRARVVAYSTKDLKRSDLPDSVVDFTDPKWKGRIGWAPTNGSFQAFVTALRLTAGDEAAEKWLKGIVANEPQAFDDNEALRDAIASGEVEAGFINHYYVTKAQEESGGNYPVAIYSPPDGDVGALVNVAGAGELVASDDDDAVRFIRFMLTDQSQRYFAGELKEYPLVPGIEADERLTPLEDIPQPDIDLSDLEDLDQTLDVLKKAGAL